MSTETARLQTTDLLGEETTQRVLVGLGRALFALPFAVFGLLHLLNASAMAGGVPAWVPGGGTLWVALTGVAMIAAAVSLATGWLARVAGPLLALLMVTFIVTLHVPQMADPQTAQLGMIAVLKNLSLAGGALILGAWRR